MCNNAVFRLDQSDIEPTSTGIHTFSLMLMFCGNVFSIFVDFFLVLNFDFRSSYISNNGLSFHGLFFTQESKI